MDKKPITKIHTNFGELLLLMFIGLKLTGHIGWSWWWVLSPIWIFLGLAGIVLVIWLIICWRAKK